MGIAINSANQFSSIKDRFGELVDNWDLDQIKDISVSTSGTCAAGK